MLKIVRDRWGVAHITGKTRADVLFGSGYVTAEDRNLLMQLVRGPSRIAALDVPGLDAFSLALSGQIFIPSQQTEDFLATQFQVLQSQARRGEGSSPTSTHSSRGECIHPEDGAADSDVDAERLRRLGRADRRDFRRRRRRRGAAFGVPQRAADTPRARRRAGRPGTTCAR